MRPTRKVLTVAATLLAALSLITPAYASAAGNSNSMSIAHSTAQSNSASAVLGVSVDANGWYHYTDTLVGSLGLLDMTTHTVTGKSAANGECEFPSVAATVNPGDSNGYSEETAFNPKTCQETIISGNLTAAGQAKLDAREKPANSATSTRSDAPSIASSANGKASPKAPATNYSETAFEKDSYVDPLDITIVSLAPNMSWTANGSIITGESNAYATSYDFQWDGWTTAGPSAWWGGGCIGCVNLQLDSSDTWQNNDFEAIVIALFGVAGLAACGFDDNTAVFQLSPYIRAGDNGSFAYGYNQPSGASGGCSNLVHFRENHGYGNGS